MKLLLMFIIRTLCIFFYGVGDQVLTTRGHFIFLLSFFLNGSTNNGGNKWNVLVVHASAVTPESSQQQPMHSTRHSELQ
jgi:hypothetical protein